MRLAELMRGCGVPVVVQVLARAVGDKRAREIVSLSCRYPAVGAQRLGLVNVVVPDERLDEEVDRWCEAILRRSPAGLRLAKLGLDAGSDRARESVLPCPRSRRTC